MSELLKSFLIDVGFAADERSARKTEERIERVERVAVTSDSRTTKAQLREALIRGRSEAKSHDDRVRYAEKLETIDKRFGGLMLRRTLRQAAAQAETSDERIKWLGRLRQAEEHHHQRTAAGLQRVAGVALGAMALIQGATLAITSLAEKAAEKLEALAYSSDRTKSSVKDLKTFSAAVSQLGGTAGGALNDLEAFAGRLRQNPQGYTAFLKSVGVEARDAKGNIRGAAELYKEFRTEVGKKPYEQQLLYAQEMGVSEETWRATSPEKLAEQEAKARARYSRMGHDPDAAAQDAVKLQNTFRDMWETIGVIGEKTLSKVFADVGDNIKGFTTFLEQHGEQIADILSKVAQVVLAVSRALLELATSDKVKGFLDWLLGAFGKVDDGTGKWVANTDKIKDALEMLATFVATIFVAKIAGAFAEILKEFKPLLALLAPFLGGTGLVAATAVGTAVAADKAVPNEQKPGAQNYWDDEASGAAGGAGIGGALKRAYGGVKRFLGIGASAADGGGAAGGTGRRSGDQSAGVAANPGAYKAVLDHIAKSEGTADKPGGGYNTSLANGLLLPGGREQDLKGKTLDEIDAIQTGMLRHPSNRWNSSAIGRYQIVRQTLRGLRRQLNLNGGDLYDEKMQDRLAAQLARQRGASATGLKDEWASLVGAKNDKAVELMRQVDPKASTMPLDQPASGAQQAGAAPTAPPVILKPEGMPDAPGITMREHLSNRAKEAAQRVNETMSTLNTNKLRAVGEATQNFDPAKFFVVPPAGTQSTTSNQTNSNSFTGGPTTINLHNHGSPADGAEILNRHRERTKADEVRYAASIFA